MPPPLETVELPEIVLRSIDMSLKKCPKMPPQNTVTCCWLSCCS